MFRRPDEILLDIRDRAFEIIDDFGIAFHHTWPIVIEIEATFMTAHMAQGRGVLRPPEAVKWTVEHWYSAFHQRDK
ncbi:MAG TPA: hypothetical protein VGJ21_00950 [Terracidiphilus sp.]